MYTLYIFISVLSFCIWVLFGELGFLIWRDKVLHRCRNEKERDIVNTKAELCKNRFRISGIVGLLVGILYR